MGKGKLYGDANNFRVQKVLAAANFGKTELNVINESPPSQRFAFQCTPALEDGSVHLFGAESICLHVGGVILAAKTQADFAEVLQWLQFSEGRLVPSVLGFVLPSLSAMQIDKKELEENKSYLLELLKVLDEYLLSRTFLVGERLSLADISMAFDLLLAYQHVLDSSSRSDLINVTRWFQTIMKLPEVVAVVGDVNMCERVEHFDGKKYKELLAKEHKQHTKKDGGKKKGDDKQKKAGDDEDLDAADKALAEEPKQVDPFAAMPKGTFNMDNFKRVYSNEDTIEKALPYFWENFDAENYSIWYAEYKYPEDLKMTFMSCNLISGMFQRLEKLKKNAFASVCLFGDDNNSTISGIWIWKGQELAFTLSPDWQIDYESYSWKKLDPKNEASKKLVNEYFAWEGNFDGKKLDQGKIFK